MIQLKGTLDRPVDWSAKVSDPNSEKWWADFSDHFVPLVNFSLRRGATSGSIRHDPTGLEFEWRAR